MSQIHSRTVEDCSCTPSSSRIVALLQVKIEKPILRIPMLAIHLNRNIRDSGFKPNPQNELTPILAASAKSQLESPMGTVASPPSDTEAPKGARHHTVLLQCIAEQLGCAVEDIVDIELNICDVQPGQLWGVQEEWVAVGRLDNLSMSWCSMQVRYDIPS